MIYLPPYLIQGTHRFTENDINEQTQDYLDLLRFLSGENFNLDELNKFETINEFIKHKKN
jgi:hypothetical protein